MDCPHPVASDDGDHSWSDSRSMDSSDDSHSMALPQSPPWADAVSRTSSLASLSSATSHMSNTGQLSPISTGVDVPSMTADGSGNCCPPSGPPPLVHSASSLSNPESWSSGYTGQDDDGDDCMGDNDVPWDQDSDDALAIPKLEPMNDDDDFRLHDLKAAPITPVGSSSAPTPAQVKVKRPRGRPRKHALTPSAPAPNKITKGRSKTGCITCRKRKKKCDEAKPRCMNCEKNAVVCEGYPEKQIWKSGKEKAEEEFLKSHSLPVITMQPIFGGLETPEDRIFWKHYNDNVSNVLTVEGEHKNAFKDILVPIATRHQGLMHSILALSSRHLDYDTPYGAKFLKRSPKITRETLQQRGDYHHEKALDHYYADMNKPLPRDDPDYKWVLEARYGQMLCLVLEVLAQGSAHGEHRYHLSAYQYMIQNSPPEDPGFQAFIVEFFQYLIFADELIRYPALHISRLAVEDWNPSNPIHPPRLLGVADGLFSYMCQITTIRNQIRSKMEAQVDPLVDYGSLYRAAEIDAAIREWTPRWPPGDSRERVSLLYKQMMWLYLFRTIYPPSPSSAGAAAMSSGSSTTAAVLSMTFGGPSSSLANTPPRSASASCVSSPSPRLEAMVPGEDLSLRRHSIAVTQSHVGDPSLYETGDIRASSPPPIRRPANHDSRITLAVEESLALLESFKPSDPAQTLLLIPCLVIGAASFAPAQQERIRSAIRTVRGYTGLRNSDRVLEVLEEVWRLMDQGDWVRVWDWQGVAHELGLDFLCV